MKPEIENRSPQKEIIEKSTSNPWFFVSVVITIILISLLIWNLVHSYDTLSRFEEEKLALSRASGRILFHARNMEMAANLVVDTRDRDRHWSGRYQQHREQINEIIETLSGMVDQPEVEEEIEIILENLDLIREIEEDAFQLITEIGDEDAQESARNLLSQWSYMRYQLQLYESVDRMTTVLDQYVNETLAVENRITRASLAFVFVALIILIFSWSFSLRIWRKNTKKRREKEKEIIHLSYHDQLTELFNRHYFMEAAEEEIERANRYDQNLSFVFMDIDKFKKVNDMYGHAAGDKVLQSVAQVIKDTTRKVDVPARMGGEEFGVLLPETDLEHAEQVAERLRKNMEQNSVECKEEIIQVTVSVGVTSFAEKVSTVDQMLDTADTALYEAKDAGRNCVRVYDINDKEIT